MDKNQRVEDGILSHTKNETARKHLSSFFAHLDKIRCAEDMSDDNMNYAVNGSDGVAAYLASDLDALQEQKLAEIENIQTDVFPHRRRSTSIEQGDINARGKYGYTRLTEAASKGDVELVKQLVAAGARWDIPDNWGQNAWDKALARGFDDVIRVFDPAFVRSKKARAETYNYDND